MTRSPAWKSDFPVSWAEDDLVTRREFTRSLVWLSGASFVGTTALAVEAAARGPSGPWPRIPVATVGELPVGGAKGFGYPSADDPCLLVRLDADTWVAFGQRCTHLGCPVYYLPREQALRCPCHEGYFDARDGSVRSGPPPRPLPRVELEREGDTLWAVGRWP